MTAGAPDPELEDDSRSIGRMCQGVLDGVVAGFDRAGVDLPERRFTKTGTPTSDCEQLVVVFRQAYVGPPGDQASDPQRCDGPRSAALEVHLTRCIPTPKGTKQVTPSAKSLDDSSKAQMRDAWLLMDMVAGLEQWDPFGGPGLGVIATVEAGEPQGAMQTTVLNLTMAIP